ncbi:hypothetical protein ACTXT7_008046 [Hymenolepis weldensis]
MYPNHVNVIRVCAEMLSPKPCQPDEYSRDQNTCLLLKLNKLQYSGKRMDIYSRRELEIRCYLSVNLSAAIASSETI